MTRKQKGSETVEGTEKPRRRAKAAPPAEVHGPSPNAATNLAIADIALRGGSILMRRAIEQTFLGKKLGTRQAKKIINGRTLGETMLHGALARVALRSVPGAIVIGGALVVKTLYDRRKARDAQIQGEATLADMAKKGES